MTYDEAIAWIRANRDRIARESSSKGLGFAREVVNLYAMHRRCPSDPGARGLFMAAVEALKASWDGEEVPIPTPKDMWRR